MSLHIEITDEAKANLNRQRRNETITSLLIAVLSLAILGLGLWALKSYIEDVTKPEIEAYVQQGGGGDDPVRSEITRTSTSTSSSAPPQAARVIASTATASIAIKQTPTQTTDPTAGISVGMDTLGMGIGSGGGGGGGGIPGIMKKRCTPQDRLARLKETGGTEACETAVVKSLDWLKAKQAANGSFPGNFSAQNCTVGQTGLVLLAYLGHCETPMSENYGIEVLKAINYLVGVGVRNDGRLATNLNDKHWPYEHAIATYALAESYTFCKEFEVPVENLKEVLTKAATYICENQCPTGGWEYNYEASASRGGDLSIVGWHVQALKAVSHTPDIRPDKLDRVLRAAEKYITTCYSSQNESFGYTAAAPNTAPGGPYALCGVGVLNLQMLGKESSKECRDGLKTILDPAKVTFDYKNADLYMHYYMAQAAMNRGGETWEKYNTMFRDQVLNNQGSDGRWNNMSKPVMGIHRYAANDAAGDIYRNALCTLMLEVYYRFLPGTGNHRR